MAQKTETVQKRIKDPVSVPHSSIKEMKIHRESLKKEYQNERIYEDFKIN